MFITNQELHGHNTRGGANIFVAQTRTIGATICLRYNIPQVIEKMDKCVLDKVNAHSPDGFSRYAKYFLISSDFYNILLYPQSLNDIDCTNHIQMPPHPKIICGHKKSHINLPKKSKERDSNNRYGYGMTSRE